MPKQTEEARSENEAAFTWKVDGMDCASCVGKIQTALAKLPGVTDIRASVMTETLTATLDQNRTTFEEVEARVAGLGYTLTRKHSPTSHRTTGSEDPRYPHADAGTGGHAHRPDPDLQAAGSSAHRHDHAQGESVGKLWWRTTKGRLVLLTGALLALAWIIKLAFPAAASWGFVAATLVGVAPITQRAVAAARARMPFTIEMLMSIAAAGALVIGAAEEGALVVFLFAVGEVLEGVAAARARASIRALGELVPKTALIEENGVAREVPAETLAIGQTVVARPGDRIPADGVILSGRSSIDESPITGESIPRTRVEGDSVFAGSINREAALRVRVTKAAEDNTIARIIRLVE